MCKMNKDSQCSEGTSGVPGPVLSTAPPSSPTRQALIVVPVHARDPLREGGDVVQDTKSTGTGLALLLHLPHHLTEGSV